VRTCVFDFLDVDAAKAGLTASIINAAANVIFNSFFINAS
jgi:hypothetical protein